MNTPNNKLTPRREFPGTSSALIGGAMAAPAILSGNLFAAENSAPLRVGLVGCGGRQPDVARG